MVLLIVASGIIGLLLGRFLRPYALIPATFLIIVPALHLGTAQGFEAGVLAFVASAVVMQIAYFASLMTYLLIENLSVIDDVQSEASSSPP